MSTNRKNNRNSRDKAVLRNWVKPQDISQRSVLNLEDKLLDSLTLSEIVDGINESIQQLNRLIAERNIPYIRIEQSQDAFNLDKTRVVLRSERSDSQCLAKLEAEFESSKENTFLVVLYLNDNGYVEIGYAEDANIKEGNFSNFILIDREYLPCALIDIFLDSAIFNSYSFLKALSPSEKRGINRKKVEYLRSVYGDFTEYDSPFYTLNNKDYKYLSMAFFARKNSYEIDLTKLAKIWNNFVQAEFPLSLHVEPSVEKQLASLVDIEQYSKAIIDSCLKLPKGTYWLLRIHRAPANVDIQLWLCAVFGRAEIGAEKIVQFNMFTPIYELVKYQHITAFKIISQ